MQSMFVHDGGIQTRSVFIRELLKAQTAFFFSESKEDRHVYTF